MSQGITIRLLSESDVRATGLSLNEIVALTEQAYRLDAQGRVEVPTKIGVHPSYPNSFLHAMPAWVDGARALGMKWVSYFPGNFDRGLPDSTGIIILNHPDNGLPVCIMEGMYVTFVRTAACAAAAVKHIRPSQPRRLGLIGCGGLGLWTLRTMTAVFPSIEEVFVASRTAASRETFCAELASECSARLMPVNEVRSAIENMDVIVSSVPPTDDPPVRPEWLSSGSIFIPLDVVNSWRDGVIAATTRVVSDNPPHFKRQIEDKRSSALDEIKDNVSLQQILAGSVPKAKPNDRTFGVVSGIASTDVVIGWEIYRRARDANLGVQFSMRA
ncbi:MAG: hypothetical protein AB7F99_18200 [Vicinamibacterales bacterium]